VKPPKDHERVLPAGVPLTATRSAPLGDPVFRERGDSSRSQLRRSELLRRIQSALRGPGPTRLCFVVHFRGQVEHALNRAVQQSLGEDASEEVSILVSHDDGRTASRRSTGSSQSSAPDSVIAPSSHARHDGGQVLTRNSVTDQQGSDRAWTSYSFAERPANSFLLGGSYRGRCNNPGSSLPSILSVASFGPASNANRDRS
jgi:hypothetical protein